MDNLFIEGKINSPTVNFDCSNGNLKLTGRSIPENPVKFYRPLESWLVSFLDTQPKKIVFYIYLDYLNTHSTECVLILFKKLESYLKISNAEVKVIWNYDYDDEDMEILGNDLASIADVPFEIKEIKED